MSIIDRILFVYHAYTNMKYGANTAMLAEVINIESEKQKTLLNDVRFDNSDDH